MDTEAWLAANPHGVVTYNDHVGDEARRAVLASLAHSKRVLVVAASPVIGHIVAEAAAVGVPIVRCRDTPSFVAFMHGARGKLVVTPQTLTFWSSHLEWGRIKTLDALIHFDPHRIRKWGAHHTRIVYRLVRFSTRFVVCGRVLTPSPADLWPVLRMLDLTKLSQRDWLYQTARLKRVGCYDIVVGWKEDAIPMARSILTPKTLVLTAGTVAQLEDDSQKEQES